MAVRISGAGIYPHRTDNERVSRTAAALQEVDVVILGQFSLARAQARLQPLLSAPVFTPRYGG